LVVDADQQAHEPKATQRPGRIDRRRQLVGGPAGGGDDPRIGQRDTLLAQRRRKLQRPASGLVEAFTDGVTVAEGEPGNRVRHRVRHRSLEESFLPRITRIPRINANQAKYISAFIRVIRGKKAVRPSASPPHAAGCAFFFSGTTLALATARRS